MNKTTTVIADDNCAGCLLCALTCSFANTPERVFNPSKAYITIKRRQRSNRFKVNFQEGCLDCGKCAESCQYGVLSTD